MLNGNSPYSSRHLEVLHVHPQPELFETLTGYLVRVAEKNRLGSADAMSALLFPNQDRRTIRTYSDFVPSNLEDLTRATASTVPRLLQATFSHVGLKFARSLKPQPLSRFMGRAVAQNFRFCPKCIAEYGYYLLTWRFRFLSGCVYHGCRLLEYCGHCCKPIPFITTPPKVGICPSCGGDLRQCGTTDLDSIELKDAETTDDDLRFLLAPQPFEDYNAQIVVEIGAMLASLRLERGLTISELASEIGVSQNMVEGMEWGKVTERGASFMSYKRYADYLGITLKALFMRTLEPRPFRKSTEDILREKVDCALAFLQTSVEPITQAEVARVAETSVGAMCRYPDIIERVREAQMEQAIRAENDLIRQVEDAVKARCWERNKISQEKIARDIGVNRAAIRKSKRATEIIREAKHGRI